MLGKSMWVTCDFSGSCDAEVEAQGPDATPAKVRREARRLGWVYVKRTESDYCPTHREEAG